ncbi:MAG: hypothetical protein QOF01_4024 [Thermomicrobiales bacterium]|nr:hypothetical protein [Thermomicrobiales bacterium]MEA2526047.1 hypothetical protein [Thermomicrobiales bacterium]MEA2597555.1 hypothetical protein [Thermomicrobiales bacterium]
MATSRFQRLIGRLVPRSWATAMEAESRDWLVRCPACGFERSIWDLGGIRWKGRGTSWTWLRCPACGKRGWHKVSRRDPTDLADRTGAPTADRPL